MFPKKRRQQAPEIVRVKVPRSGQTLGVIEEMLGGGRFRVNCKDGNLRVCKISGRFRKGKWIRPGNIVLVEPWDIQGDERGNIVWKYRKAEIYWLRKKGFLEGLI